MSIDASRIEALNERPARDGRYVLYWMQAAQRAAHNEALEHAVARANERALPLLVVFGLMDDYPDANLRHYRFMLQGLAGTARALADRGIGFALRRGAPDEVALAAADEAAEIVCDRGYLRHQKAWRRTLADRAPCPVRQVETEAVVPLHVASDKAEYAARTIRPRIHRHLDSYLQPLPATPLDRAWEGEPPAGEDPSDLDALLDDLAIDRTVGAVDPFFVGGYDEARGRLERFLDGALPGYDERRSHPGDDATSTLSPYLHFGQISAIELALAARDHDAPGSDRDAFLEELIVRRQLAQNYCEFTDAYDAYDSLPDWARRTLAEHADDEREHRYDEATLVAAESHDRYWNGAMREMTATGYMHNYMRMYWGKKILEWTGSPEAAFDLTLRLNNRYFLDGRDPNSYASVAWIYGLHDRAWTERAVFGKVRYMNARGLERKFDMDAYLAKVERLEARAEAARFGP